MGGPTDKWGKRIFETFRRVELSKLVEESREQKMGCLKALKITAARKGLGEGKIISIIERMTDLK